jgi:hypothetical protein
MRNLIAGLIALVLLLFALRMVATLRFHQQRRRRDRDAAEALGRVILVEIPGGDGFVPFSEDAEGFYYGERPIPKRSILAARLLVNGAPIATTVAEGAVLELQGRPRPEELPEGILRDRWDVDIESRGGTIVIACGAIRERVSQEMANTVFEAVKRSLTTRFPPRPHDD